MWFRQLCDSAHHLKQVSRWCAIQFSTTLKYGEVGALRNSMYVILF